MKTLIRQTIVILLSFIPFATNAQNDSIKEKITSHFDKYFGLEREIIHVQLDKDVFLSDEQIWFKGYVLNRKTKTPFSLTTNVFAVLMDQQGNKMEEQLVFSSGGSFSGNLKLGKRYC